MNLEALLADLNPWWHGTRTDVAALLPRRALHREVLDRAARPIDLDRRAIVLMGPRQVGKTTLLRQVAVDLVSAGLPGEAVTYFDFSDDRLIDRVSPDEVVQHVRGASDSARPRLFLLDEIGAAGDWSRWLRRMVDDASHRFVVTDSSAELLRGGGKESGTGRWDEKILEPLTYPEVVSLLSAESVPGALRSLDPLALYLSVGGFPEHVFRYNGDPSAARQRLRMDIVDRAIYRDLMRHDVDVARVRDLFVYLVEESGSIFDAVGRAQDVGADPRSVRDWERLLLDTLLLHRVERWTKRPSARLRAKPKIYAADHGLVAAFSISDAPLSDPGVRGKVFESVVLRHLREIARGRITYFREDDDLEADFVVETQHGVVAVEVTSTAVPEARKVKRLAAAAAKVGARRALLVHGGDASSERDGVTSVPLRQFLERCGELVAGGPSP